VDVATIRCLRTQFVYMTATLPPTQEAAEGNTDPQLTPSPR
jgi:hypothetical protein